MACEGLTADDYLHRLAKAPLPTLDLGKDSNHGESLLKVLNLSLGKVRATDRLANDLLALLAQFGDAPVPEEIFDEPRTIFPILHCRRGQQDSRRAKHKRAKLSAASFALHDKFRDPIDRDSAVRVLHRYSLVRREQHGFVIHSLVARVIRDQQKSWDAEFYPLAAMGLVMPKLMRWHADPSSVDPVLAHLQSIADRANLLNYDSPAFSAIYSVLGRRLSQLGFHDRALLNSNIAVTLADRLAPISADYRGMYVQARVMHVMVLVSVGEPQEAARQMREIIDRTRRAYNHESMHFFYRILASAQLRARDPIAAEATLAELDSYVAGSREPLADIERIEVLVLRAWVLRLTGKSRSALKLMRDARSLAGEAGASDFDEVSILREEGSLEREIGDLTGAIRTQKLLIGRLEDRNIGIDLDLLLSVDHLANLEIEAGLLDASEETCGRAAELARSLLGEKHIYYGQILTTRGRLELVRGQHAHAIRDLTAGISRIEAGAQSPVDLAPAYFHLARGYTEVGQFSEAVDAAKKCLEIDTRQYGENHWEIAEDLIMLAHIHLRVGNLSAARECVLRCRDIPLPSEGRSDLRSLVSSMLFAFEQ
ncbi:tetratricopeptide repeat protein [Candidatus Protofrankia californiensis]|uniref:tetratricopeptide repeat protein n=1 Tax=Candidatus Protofrankia californiensis TaxID=1839754 RepID=UPI0010417776|nr:tetratricopeptide repeat protein [Candidatus Protofrankia californiensis]